MYSRGPLGHLTCAHELLLHPSWVSSVIVHQLVTFQAPVYTFTTGYGCRMRVAQSSPTKHQSAPVFTFLEAPHSLVWPEQMYHDDDMASRWKRACHHLCLRTRASELLLGNAHWKLE